MELLGGRAVWSMDGSEMLSTLDALEAEIARLQTYRLRVIAGIEDIGYAREIGAHDTARLLTFRHRIDSSDAHRDVRLARALSKYDAVSAALPDTTPLPSPGFATVDVPVNHSEATADDLPAAEEAMAHESPGRRWPLRPAHAGAIMWALDRVAARVTAGDLAVAEEQLVGLAAHLSPGELRKAGKQLGDLLDSDGPGPDEHKAYGRESLTLANGANGVNFRGFLANENAELLRSLIHLGARPRRTVDGELDPRSREKRQADALSAALTVAAAATDAGLVNTTSPTRSAASAPTRTVPAPATTSIGAASVSTDTGPARGSTDAGDAWQPADAVRPVGGQVPGFGAKANISVTIDFDALKAATADATGDVVYGDALSAAVVRRLACDANILPIVLGSNSEPLDVGRSERLVNRAMRRALNARDKGCVVCGAPPIQCEAHHIQSWIDGGPTAVNNLVLLCRRHHIDLHAGHWTITIANGTVHVSRPTWADPLQPTTHRSAPRHSRSSAASAASPHQPTESESYNDRPDRGTGRGGPRAKAPWALTPIEVKPDAVGSAEPPRSKWKADGTRLEEAARFAVRDHVPMLPARSPVGLGTTTSTN